jgi:hypothetical protein
MNKGIRYTIVIFVVWTAIAVIVAAVLSNVNVWNSLVSSLPYPIGASSAPVGHHGILYKLFEWHLYGTATRNEAWLIIIIIAAVIVGIDIYGIFMAKKWARTLAILISIPMIAGILMGFGTLWYLITQPNGKRYFGIPVTPKPEQQAA